MKVEDIKVSVIMSCYNEAESIGRAIESMLNQSFTDFEFIIVDDCSTDTTFEICREYAAKDERVKVFQMEENSGFCAAPLNYAIKQAKSDIIARMDADDASHKQRLQKQYDFLQAHPDVDILGTGRRTLSKESGEVIKINVRPESHKEIISGKYFKSFCYHPTVMLRKTVYDTFGGYDINAYRCEDTDLWLKAFPHFKFHNMQDLLLDFYEKEHPINIYNKKAFVSSCKIIYKAIIRNKDYLYLLPVFTKKIMYNIYVRWFK